MAWFALNTRDPDAQQFTYTEIPMHYTWKKRRWERRQRNGIRMLGRLYFVQPKDRERFYLRLLLLHVRGATSFRHLRTVDGVVYDTYRETAIALHLLEDDNEWCLCIEEAVTFQSPQSLRQLFALVLDLCQPAQPLILWERFASDLSEDKLHARRFAQQNRLLPQDQDQSDDAKKEALADIDRFLKEAGSSLAKFPELPQDFNVVNELNANDNLGIEDNMEELEQEAIRNFNLLNADQHAAFDRIIASIQGEIPQKLFFIDGPGGTGKSFLYNTSIAHIRSQLHGTVIVTASSRIAALILRDGRTAHSTFNIPIAINSQSICGINANSELADRIANSSAIFWDEAPMQHRHLFEAVDRTFRDIMRNDDVFGGKVLVFGGDFRQILPVVTRGSQGQIENACLKNSVLWNSIETLRLAQNMRVMDNPEDQPFIDFLLQVGEGIRPTATQSGPFSNFIRIPDEFVFHPVNPSEGNSPQMQLIRHMYLNLENAPLLPEDMLKRAILSPLNKDVNVINNIATEVLHGGETTTYLAQDSVEDEDEAGQYPAEYLNTLEPSGFPPFRLLLKIGQPIMLLRNMNPKRGLCNGTRLIVRQLTQRCIKAEIVNGKFMGQMVFLPRIPLITPDDDGTSPVKFRHRQFPVKPSFAMTINKSQGQSLQYVSVYLPKPPFSHGQLYVALSRCTEPSNLKLLIYNGSIPGMQGVYTRNVVYKNVL